MKERKLNWQIEQMWVSEVNNFSLIYGMNKESELKFKFDVAKFV